MNCVVCGNNRDNRLFTAREMMFGYKDRFEYFECRNCGCVQISEMPKNLTKYYPEGYYSLSSLFSHNNPLKKILLAKKITFELFDKGFIGRLISKFRPPDMSLNALKRSQISINSNVLDVGSGTGSFLYKLKIAGLRHITGIDPFIKKTIVYSPDFVIFKGSINDIDGNFDFVTFNHSFEHMYNQFETLMSVKKVLNKNGICIIRMPTVSSYAYDYYGSNWVQLDPPRHVVLHSIDSLKILLKKAKLKLTNIIYDSTEFQFWGSEQYQRDIPLNSPKSYGKNPNQNIISKNKIKQYRNRARELNKNRRGDQAIFFIEQNN